MKRLLLIALIVAGVNAQAQITKASLQASGLTCSMCSKAVKSALEELSFVEKVQVDIKNQQYNISFKDGQAFEVDDLQKAVSDAGFSIAKLNITAKVEEKQLKKDEHLKIGNHTFHFLNAANQTINGEATFTVVDKNFVSAKDFKKYSALTKMECVKTGKMASCCSSFKDQPARIYHVII